MVAMILEAFPTAGVDVYGEQSHLAEVSQLLGATRPLPRSRVEWHSLAIPARRAKGWARMRGMTAMFRNLRGRFRARRPDAIVMLSTDPASLVCLKMCLLFLFPQIRSAAVFHEWLAALERPHSRRRRVLLAVLALPHPALLRYVVLAPGAVGYIETLAPRLARHTVEVRHPSLLGELPISVRRPHGSEFRVGFVGGGRDAKGMSLFLEIVRQLGDRGRKVRFCIVGTVPDALLSQLPPGIEYEVQKLPLTEFAERVRRLDVVIWPGDPSHYQLVASGSLVDSVALGTPVIYRAGNYADALMASIGYQGQRFSSVTEAVEILAGILARNEWNESRDAVRGAAIELLPEATAQELRRLLG